MALNITDLKKGTIFRLNNQPFRVIDYSQKVMGRGGSIVNLKVKNLVDGKVLEKTLKGNEQVDQANLNIRNVQYLYNDGSKFYFMDEENYEQFEISKDIIDDLIVFLTEGLVVKANLLDGHLINIELPNNIPLNVTYTENVVRGDTANNVMKDATLSSGLVIKVPAFIKQGDTIKVDTRTGSYLERV